MVASHRHTESIYGNQIPSADELPHFMSLSCIPNAISSCLFSSFWEPCVTCNLVSEWLYPILKEVLPPLVKEKRFHVIVHMMASRRQNIASLWLGVAITGLLPRILQVHSSFLPPTCLEEAVWSSSPQSFMDPEFHRKPQIHRRRNPKGDDEKAISREDEYRLLYLTDVESQVYRQPPLSPYAPFGLVSLQDAALEVRLHATCGHGLVYAAWIWKGQDGRILADPGIITSSAKQAPPSQSTSKNLAGHRGSKDTRTLPLGSGEEKEEELSEQATRNIFSWTFFVDGVRPDEAELWRHEWLSFLLDEKDEDDDGSSVDSSS